MKKKIPNFPKYKQDLGDGRVRIITIVTYGKTKVTAACKEIKDGDEAKAVFYHKSAMGNAGVDALKKQAMGFYGVTEDQRIK